MRVFLERALAQETFQLVLLDCWPVTGSAHDRAMKQRPHNSHFWCC